MVPAFCAEKGWITEPRRFSAWFGCPPKAAAFAKLLSTCTRKRKAGNEPPPLVEQKTLNWVPFSVVGRGGLPSHGALARGSAIREAAAFAKLLPTGSRRRKAGSEPPPLKRTSKRRPFSVVGRGGLPSHGALARGSAVRRRRQLSRSCCQPALEDEKPEANLHPHTDVALTSFYCWHQW